MVHLIAVLGLRSVHCNATVFYCLQLVLPENTTCTHNKNLQLLLSKLASFSWKSQCLDRREPRCRRAPMARRAATAQPGACVATITIPDASSLPPCATLRLCATLSLHLISAPQ